MNLWTVAGAGSERRYGYPVRVVETMLFQYTLSMQYPPLLSYMYLPLLLFRWAAPPLERQNGRPFSGTSSRFEAE